MTDETHCLFSASAVAIGDVALAIEGPPGSGKSSLALALIDRGAQLIGDDCVTLTRSGKRLIASPPPNIEGLLELRGVGLFNFPLSEPRPLSLILSLRVGGERLPDVIPLRDILGVNVPYLPFYPDTLVPAVRAELALAKHGLHFG
ncbi:HPr kinase/phosphatase C-terminal domain-containing protein [uncultured Erythrobacter sp.]|uniref:HPr kinase/phosphorylase n=1 Tax=uncultured Erythrobacter sp. TaxID=263913 RepID=UPI00261E507A|nr:HPr kinase/phosphatase C-terminal domain-containing protein [uncultured Erythrobacter sp.]